MTKSVVSPDRRRESLDRKNYKGQADSIIGVAYMGFLHLGRNRVEKALAAGAAALTIAGGAGVANTVNAEAMDNDCEQPIPAFTYDTNRIGEAMPSPGGDPVILPEDCPPFTGENVPTQAEVEDLLKHLLNEAGIFNGGSNDGSHASVNEGAPASTESQEGAHIPPQQIPEGVYSNGSQYFSDIDYAVQQTDAEGVVGNYSGFGLLEMQVNEGVELPLVKGVNVEQKTLGPELAKLQPGERLYSIENDSQFFADGNGSTRYGTAIYRTADGRYVVGNYKGEEVRGQQTFPTAVAVSESDSGTGTGEKFVDPSTEILAAPLAEVMARNAYVDELRMGVPVEQWSQEALYSWHALEFDGWVLDPGDARTAVAMKTQSIQWGERDIIATTGEVGKQLREQDDAQIDAVPVVGVDVYVEGQGIQTELVFPKDQRPQELIKYNDQSALDTWLSSRGLTRNQIMQYDMYFNDNYGLEAVRTMDRGALVIYVFAAPERGFSYNDTSFLRAWGYNSHASTSIDAPVHPITIVWAGDAQPSTGGVSYFNSDLGAQQILESDPDLYAELYSN